MSGMFTRTIFRGAALGILIIQLFVSVAEAAICKPCPTPAVTACASSCETATTSFASPESRNKSCPPATQDSGDHLCTLCPSCLAPCIVETPALLSRNDHIQRFALPEYSTLYEAPSFSLLRPPIRCPRSFPFFDRRSRKEPVRTSSYTVKI